MWETYEEMQGTMFQYSALKEYAGNGLEINPITYLGADTWKRHR